MGKLDNQVTVVTGARSVNGRVTYSQQILQEYG